MIAIDMPMPCSCSECIFRDGPYDCMLDNQIRVANILKPSECPLLEVWTIQARNIGESIDASRRIIARKIGESLGEGPSVRFTARRFQTKSSPPFILPKYIDMVGEVNVVVPKEGR